MKIVKTIEDEFAVKDFKHPDTSPDRYLQDRINKFEYDNDCKLVTMTAIVSVLDGKNVVYYTCIFEKNPKPEPKYYDTDW